ncbi:hypothetical protein GKZ89_16135 [Bacillus mangrovi]|uniref:YhfM-like domain-containing protein n=2 Tax=Metabacillus mangrovi TaxID=1491830 RepID=A0A7X2S780_9BACI|nr:hypothetical protein [Metabacillus mangrovi]
MVLLDEKISEINLSKSNGTGEMNEEILLSIKDQESIRIFEQAITSAVKQSGTPKMPMPDYDAAVHYKADVPPHALHFWLGEQGRQSTFMYVTDDDAVYLTSAKMTEKLRELMADQK